MNQQQQKHSSKNYKRNSNTKLLSTEFVAIDENGTLKASLNNYEEYKALKTKTNYNWYMIKTFSLNNKTITIKQKEN